MKGYSRFGLVYYGCCEPLHTKLDIIKKIPNLRKISMSPWVDVEKGGVNNANTIKGDIVGILLYDTAITNSERQLLPR